VLGNVDIRGMLVKMTTDSNHHRTLAAFSYAAFGVFAVWLLSHDTYVRWHVRQGLLMLGFLLGIIILNQWFPRIGTILFMGWLLIDIIALLKALAGQKWSIPLVGELLKIR
jgi:uncharacterized membrane protein